MNFVIPAAGLCSRVSSVMGRYVLKGNIKTRFGSAFESIRSIYEACKTRGRLVCVCRTANIEEIANFFGEMATYVIQEKVDSVFVSIRKGVSELPLNEPFVILCYDEVFADPREIAVLLDNCSNMEKRILVTIKEWDGSSDYGVFKLDNKKKPCTFRQSGEFVECIGPCFAYRGVFVCATPWVLTGNSLKDFFVKMVVEEQVVLHKIETEILDVGTIKKIVEAQ